MCTEFAKNLCGAMWAAEIRVARRHHLQHVSSCYIIGLELYYAYLKDKIFELFLKVGLSTLKSWLLILIPLSANSRIWLIMCME